MAGTGFSFSSTGSSPSSPFSFSSSAATSSSLLFSFSSNPASSPTTTTTTSSSPFSFFSNPSSTSSSAPSSSPSFGFGSFGASASSTGTPLSNSSPLLGSAPSGSGFTSCLFGSCSSAPTAGSTGSPLFGAPSFGSGAATSSPFGASTLFGSSTSTSASGSTNILGSGLGSSGSIFGATAASSPFGSSTPSPAGALVAASSASTSPFSSGLFSSTSTKFPAVGSSSQPQSTAAALSGTPISLAGTCSGCSAFCLRIGFGDEEEEVWSEDEQVGESVLEQLLIPMNNSETNHNEFFGVSQNQGGKSDSSKDVGCVEQVCESSAVACSSTAHIKEFEAIPAVVSAETILLSTSSVESALVIGDNPNIQPAVADMGKQQPSKDVAEGQEETSANSSVVPEVGLSNAVDQADVPKFFGVSQNQGGKSDSLKDVGGVEQACESSAVACSSTVHIKELEAIPAVVLAETILLSTSSAESASVIGDSPIIRPAVADLGKQQPSKDVAEGQEETSANSSVVHEVVGDEVGLSNAVGQAFSVFSCCSGLNYLTLSPADAQMVIKNILDKHGDITEGSIMKSLVMRSTLLQVVAEVVHRLGNHTMNTLSSDELQLMKRLADDVDAIGFSVDWLQEKLKKVSMASKYHECLLYLERLGEQINAAKKSLMEMELQQLVLKKEVDCMKFELEGMDFEGSNLGEGLI